MDTALSIKINGFSDLKIQFLDDCVINVISKDPLTENQLCSIVKYLYDEGFCEVYDKHDE